MLMSSARAWAYVRALEVDACADSACSSSPYTAFVASTTPLLDGANEVSINDSSNASCHSRAHHQMAAGIMASKPLTPA